MVFRVISDNHVQLTHTYLHVHNSFIQYHTHTNIVWKKWKSLISSALFSQFLNSWAHHFYHFQALRSAEISSGNSVFSPSGSSPSHLFPRFKGVVKSVLCYTTQITLRMKCLFLPLLGVLLWSDAYLSACFGIFWLNALSKAVLPPGIAYLQYLHHVRA